MQKHIKKVDFRSIWEDGVVDTTASLDLKTGEIFDIIRNKEDEEALGIHEMNVVYGANDEEITVDILGKFDNSIDIQDIHLF